MTYSLLLTDQQHRWLVVACATCTPAVGSMVPAARARVGGVVSQAHTNPALRGAALDLLAAGSTTEAAVRDALGQDDRPQLRQLGLLDANGRAAHYTGADVSPRSGAIARPDMLALGNLLTGPEVLVSMAAVADPESLSAQVDGLGIARRALDALRAGQRAGGDRRGQQSASILVMALDGNRDDAPAIDLRADDDAAPLDMLDALLERVAQGA